MYIDLNCDLGEGIGNDEEILNYITSANIACGYHAGDYEIMKKTVGMCKNKGVKIGAHPGFPDRENFGRKNMDMSLNEIKKCVNDQVKSIYKLTKDFNVELNHVKPHGALYNMAAKDYSIAKAIAETIYDIDKKIILVGLSNSNIIKAAEDTGLEFLNEVFADRAYNNDGTLVSRTIDGAVLHDIDLCVDRVVKMIKEKKVESIDGTEINIKVDTICLHGDNEEALQLAKSIYTRVY